MDLGKMDCEDHRWLELVQGVFSVDVGMNSVEPSGYATRELVI
jgi:hypothetical protein